MKKPGRALLALAVVLCAPPAVARAQTFHVAPVAAGGSDTSGNGSAASPWATIGFAQDQVPDGATILVEPGTYTGLVRLDRAFAGGVLIRSRVPYRARLRNSEQVVICYTCQGITLEGFDIAHAGPGAAPLVIQIQDLIPGADFTRRVTLRDNVIHDSHNNDLLKINNGAGEIVVEGNLFYNQSGSDEHIDINSVHDVTIEGNVFFNDFEGSGRVDGGDTSSFLVIKDSNGADDGRVGSEGITVRRNVFLHWQGSSGSNFVLVGEDGHPYYEARNVLVENNLFLGDSPSVMRSAFGVKGGRDVVYRHNTVSGDLPSLAYAVRLNVEGSNPANDEIDLLANAWSDPTGSMGASTATGADDFSDTPPGETLAFTLAGNLYWNGGEAVPDDPAEWVNPSDDATGLFADPRLPSPAGVTPPRWLSGSGVFADGSARIAAVHRKLALAYGTPPPGSPLVDTADPATAPADDLRGYPRETGRPDVGAVEAAAIFADDFERGDLTAWSARTP